jgi:hypothetical protein
MRGGSDPKVPEQTAACCRINQLFKIDQCSLAIFVIQEPLATRWLISPILTFARQRFFC